MKISRNSPQQSAENQSNDVGKVSRRTLLGAGGASAVSLVLSHHRAHAATSDPIYITTAEPLQPNVGYGYLATINSPSAETLSIKRVDGRGATHLAETTARVAFSPDHQSVVFATSENSSGAPTEAPFEFSVLQGSNQWTFKLIIATGFQTISLAERYDPYGGATRTDGGGNNGGVTENPYLFGQGVQDRATGELKFGQRWYSPTTGSWTQQDALNAPLDPNNGNRYQYAADNPVNEHDPNGRQEDSCSEGSSCTIDSTMANPGYACTYLGTCGQGLSCADLVGLAGTAAGIISVPLTGGTDAPELYGAYAAGGVGIGTTIAADVIC